MPFCPYSVSREQRTIVVLLPEILCSTHLARHSSADHARFMIRSREVRTQGSLVLQMKAKSKYTALRSNRGSIPTRRVWPRSTQRYSFTTSIAFRASTRYGNSMPPDSQADNPPLDKRPPQYIFVLVSVSASTPGLTGRRTRGCPGSEIPGYASVHRRHVDQQTAV